MKRSVSRLDWRALFVSGLLILVTSVSALADNIFPTPNGNVGIGEGTTAPSTALEIRSLGTALTGNLHYTVYQHNAAGSIGSFLGYDGGNLVGVLGSSGGASNGLAFTTNGFVERMRIDGNGNVGVGTVAPAFLLDVAGTDPSARISATNAGGGARLMLDTPTRDWRLITHSSFADNFYLYDGTAAAVRLLVNTAGNVGIGTTSPAAKLHVAGDAQVDGNLAAKYQDVAEWVQSATPLPAGVVVVADVQRRNQVLAASDPYDTRVVGVVSARPGLLLGEGGESKVKVAHSGRVKVKVDASYGPVAVGDLLVTSPTTGYAMRSTPVELGGTLIHRPGTLLGKALEPLDTGQGEILVLLTLQ
jgi:hypothetical protein